MLLTSEETLFIKVQTMCEHSGEYYVTTIRRVTINLLGSHARSRVLGIKYCWPICYMLHLTKIRLGVLLVCKITLNIPYSTPRKWIN
jgi:hypothetical protein